MNQNRQPDPTQNFKFLIMGMLTFLAFGDFVLKMVLYYFFKYPFLNILLVIYAGTLYSFGTAYIFLPKYSFSTSPWMKIFTIWGFFVMIFSMTSDIAQQFVIYDGNKSYCKRSHTCTYWIFIHSFFTLLYNGVIGFIILADIYGIKFSSGNRNQGNYQPVGGNYQYQQNTSNQPLLYQNQPAYQNYNQPQQPMRSSYPPPSQFNAAPQNQSQGQIPVQQVFEMQPEKPQNRSYESIPRQDLPKSEKFEPKPVEGMLKEDLEKADLI